MKSRGRSPAPHTRPRDNLRGGSAGPRPGPGSSTYSSEAEDGQVVVHPPLSDEGGLANSSNSSPNHTLAGHASQDQGENLSNSIWYDEFDGSGLDPVAKQKALGQFQAKMNKTREQIKEEQISRDENVDEYLRLSSCADRQQLSRIKQVFEKKNQKSAQNIAQLQKKLENYQRKVREIEHGAIPHPKQHKEVLKAVGAGIKGGVVGTWNKPKEFAHLIRNKFGSADNIPTSLGSKEGSWGESTENSREGLTIHKHPGHKRTQSGNVGGNWGQNKSHHGSASLPRDGRGTESGGGSVPSVEGGGSPSGSSVTSESVGGREGEESRNWEGSRSRDAGRDEDTTQLGLESLMSEIHERREECDKLARDLELQRQQFKQELEYLGGQLREETVRCDRLEEQMNDLTELHQNEMEIIKSGVTDMEEKVQYQSEERIRDIQDQLSSLESKILRMEHQAAQHQQYVTLEGIENSNARALVVKAINVLLTLLQVLLLVLATAAQILKPFLRTPARVVTTVLLVTVLVLAVRQWREIKDFSVQFHPRGKNPNFDKEEYRDKTEPQDL